jgi:hypothetical protein
VVLSYGKAIGLESVRGMASNVQTTRKSCTPDRVDTAPNSTDRTERAWPSVCHDSVVDDRARLVTQVVREAADEWTSDGRMHLPPDDASGDADVGFWDEVERRVEQRLEQATSPTT